MKDYSMGFKNRDIDRFSNKFGKKDGEPQKKMEVNKENSKKIIREKIDKYLEELQILNEKGKGLMADKRKEEIKKKIAVHQNALNRVANR